VRKNVCDSFIVNLFAKEWVRCRYLMQKQWKLKKCRLFIVVRIVKKIFVMALWSIFFCFARIKCNSLVEKLVKAHGPIKCRITVTQGNQLVYHAHGHTTFELQFLTNCNFITWEQYWMWPCFPLPFVWLLESWLFLLITLVSLQCYMCLCQFV
jgi:hypothetical protein